jgi:hypothetical protein
MHRLLFALLILPFIVNAQTPAKKAPDFSHREDLVVLSLTSDNWTDLPKGIESKPLRSRGFSFLFMTEKMNSSKTLGLGVGMGFMSQNVHTNAYITDTGSASMLSPVPDSMDMKLNKLSTNFITAALEVRLRTKENNKGGIFKLSAGILAGFMLQDHVKYEDGKIGKIKYYDIQHLNKFQYGIEGRIGYNKVAINGYYSLVPVFEDGEGPEMTPYSIGISLTL